MSGKKEADLVGEVSGIPYFLLRLLTDLSLVPDSEVMLEVRGRGEEERRGKERRKKPLLLLLHIQKKRPPGRFQLTTRPCSLLFSGWREPHFQTHVDTGYIPKIQMVSFLQRVFASTGKKNKLECLLKKQVV